MASKKEQKIVRRITANPTLWTGYKVKAVEKAREVNMKVIGLTGAKGAVFAEGCDLALVVPSEDVARIQEAHICAGHLICQLVEAAVHGAS